MIRGSRLPRVQLGRSAHAKQSFRANRASNAMPPLGQVCGSQEQHHREREPARRFGGPAAAGEQRGELIILVHRTEGVGDA
jgi:hypothetical protein